MIDVALLGTGGMMPLPHRFLSSVLIRHAGRLILMDAGEGTQVAMRGVGWGFKQVDAILVTHLHADHVGGILGVLLMAMNSGRTDPLDIYGPEQTAIAIRGLCCVMPAPGFYIRVTELSGGEQFAIGALQATCAAGEHRMPVLGYRLDLPRAPRFDTAAAVSRGVPKALWSALQHGQPVALDGQMVEPSSVTGPARRGLRFTFITDTRPSEQLRMLASDSDLLVCEGTYGDPDDRPKAVAHRHMTFAEAATLAKDANVLRLWLTHFSPSMADPGRWEAAARSIFDATTVGHDSLTTALHYHDEGSPTREP